MVWGWGPLPVPLDSQERSVLGRRSAGTDKRKSHLAHPLPTPSVNTADIRDS